MLRRVPDYPDSYSVWNAFASFGLLISVFATIIFILGVYVTLTNDKTNDKINDKIKKEKLNNFYNNMYIDILL